MRFNQFDLNLLVAFRVMTEEKNVTRASERLNITQSAMSAALRRLREYFNDDLFIQSGRQMVLTPLAESLSGKVVDLLLRAQSLVETQPAFDPRTAVRSVKIIASDYVFTAFLQDVIRELRRISPGISFEIIPHTHNNHAMLDRGNVDLLIVPARMLSDAHPNQDLFSENFACIVASESPVQNETLTPEAYLAMKHVVIRFGVERAYTFEKLYFEKNDLPRKEDIVVHGFHMVAQMVSGTDLIATMPKNLATYFSGLFPVRVVATPLPFPPLTEAMQWHRSQDHDPIMRWIRGYILEKARGG